MTAIWLLLVSPAVLAYGSLRGASLSPAEMSSKLHDSVVHFNTRNYESLAVLGGKPTQVCQTPGFASGLRYVQAMTEALLRSPIDKTGEVWICAYLYPNAARARTAYGLLERAITLNVLGTSQLKKVSPHAGDESIAYRSASSYDAVFRKGNYVATYAESVAPKPMVSFVEFLGIASKLIARLR
jgi:hypothetical protein